MHEKKNCTCEIDVMTGELYVKAEDKALELPAKSIVTSRVPTPGDTPLH